MAAVEECAQWLWECNRRWRTPGPANEHAHTAAHWPVDAGLSVPDDTSTRVGLTRAADTWLSRSRPSRVCLQGVWAYCLRAWAVQVRVYGAAAREALLRSRAQSLSGRCVGSDAGCCRRGAACAKRPRLRRMHSGSRETAGAGRDAGLLRGAEGGAVQARAAAGTFLRCAAALERGTSRRGPGRVPAQGPARETRVGGGLQLRHTCAPAAAARPSARPVSAALHEEEQRSAARCRTWRARSRRAMRSVEAGSGRAARSTCAFGLHTPAPAQGPVTAPTRVSFGLARGRRP